MKNNYYVYRFIRLDNYTPFYVGASNKINYGRAYDTRGRSNSFKNIHSKTEIKVEIIADNLSKEEAEIKETEFIKLYGCLRLGGILVNVLRHTYMFTEEHKLKLSNGKKNELNPFFNKTHTEEFKKKKRDLIIGDKNPNFLKKGELNHRFKIPHTEEAKKKISESTSIAIKEWWRLKKLNQKK
jgi:hypothetical protein